MLPDHHGAEAVQAGRLDAACSNYQDLSDRSLVERADLAIEVALHRIRDRFRNRPPFDWHRMRPIHQ